MKKKIAYSKAEKAKKTPRHFLNLAYAVAKRSPHPAVRVGAVLVAKNGEVLSVAWNDFALGVKKKPERLAEGNKSYWLMCAEKHALHAARARLHKLGAADFTGCTLYTTLDPCHTCADDIIGNKMMCVAVPKNARAHYPKLKKKWTKSLDVATVKLREAGVKRKLLG